MVPRQPGPAMVSSVVVAVVVTVVVTVVVALGTVSRSVLAVSIAVVPTTVRGSLARAVGGRGAPPGGKWGGGEKGKISLR